MNLTGRKISADGVIYTVRHDYKHRGENPRLVFEEKIKGIFISLQFDQNNRFEKDVNEGYAEKYSYRGYINLPSGMVEINEIKLLPEN